MTFGVYDLTFDDATVPSWARAVDRVTGVMTSPSLFHVIVEDAPTAMLVVDGDRRIALVNRGAEQMFGYTREALLGQPIDLLVPDRFVAAHGSHLDAYFAGKPRAIPLGTERQIVGRHRDGSEIPIEIGLSPIESPTGPCVLASIIDITARRRAEAGYSAIVEAMPNAIVMVNAEQRVTMVNRSAIELFGYEREEMVGAAIEMLLPETLSTEAASAERSSTDLSLDLEARRKDGTLVPVEIALSQVRTDAGAFTVASITDITKRRRAEAELRRSNAELEQFAYVASHDLQEPLRMVASYTELLAQRYRGKLDEKADKYIEYAVDGAKRMQQLVMDLLAYSRVGSGGKTPGPVRSQTIVEQVLRSLTGAIRSANATVEVGPLPVVMADATQLGQLFQNLIGNAVKFHGDEPPRIRVEATREGEMWRFTVADNGIGIEPQYAARVFQMFQRLHERGRFEGSGIGLAIAKRIVERHGGRIWFGATSSENGPAGGTTFHFTLNPAPGSADPS